MVKKYSRLHGKIIEKYGNVSQFAKACGLSRVSVDNKLEGRTAFTKRDMEHWSELLGISTDKISEYYFESKVESR